MTPAFIYPHAQRQNPRNHPRTRPSLHCQHLQTQAHSTLSSLLNPPHPATGDSVQSCISSPMGNNSLQAETNLHPLQSKLLKPKISLILSLQTFLRISPSPNRLNQNHSAWPFFHNLVHDHLFQLHVSVLPFLLRSRETEILALFQTLHAIKKKKKKSVWIPPAFKRKPFITDLRHHFLIILQTATS